MSCVASYLLWNEETKAPVQVQNRVDIFVTPYWLTTLQLHHQVISLNKETMTNLPYIAPPCNLDAMGSLGLAKWGGGKCSYEYVGEHLQTSGSLLGSMSIAKLTSIRTVIRITCETLMANWLLWPWSRSPVVATWPKRTRVYFTGTNSTSRGEQSGFDAKKNPNKKKQHVTHHSSQNLLDPRNPR